MMIRNVYLIFVFLFSVTTTLAQGFELIRTIEVAGRQGVTADSNYYYVSGSKSLYKYAKDGKLLASNDTPFKQLTLKANHLGDIDYHNGEIFTGVEFFDNGKAINIQIIIYDAETLEFKRFYTLEPESGQKEVCGITVDAKNNTIWMADWIDGAYLYKYDLNSGKYLAKQHIFPVPEKQQGVKVWNNKILITSDDGDAEYNEPDHLYSIPVLDNKTSVEISLLKTFDDVKFNGEIEGLSYDETINSIIVHFNRGTRVVNGMPTGFYPGYEKEIHELYIYKIISEEEL